MGANKPANWAAEGGAAGGTTVVTGGGAEGIGGGADLALAAATAVFFRSAGGRWIGGDGAAEAVTGTQRVKLTDNTPRERAVADDDEGWGEATSWLASTPASKL